MSAREIKCPLPPTERCNRLFLAATLLALAFSSAPAEAQLRGHGGPVRALAVSADGSVALSGSFDTSAIRWSLARGVAEQVLRFHAGAVDAVMFLKDGRLATAGEDARIALWTPGKTAPDEVLEGHRGPIVALAVSPDGTELASAAWDRTVRLWPLAGGAARVLEGHQQNVNAVAFAPDGKTLVSAGYDASLRFWPLAGDHAPILANLPTPLNALAIAPDGEIATAGADGRIYFVTPAGAVIAKLEASPAPITSLAMSRDGELIAAASMSGAVAVVERKTRTLLRNLAGPRGPVWAVAFVGGSDALLSGGADRIIHRWNAKSGELLDAATSGGAEDPLAAYAGDPGADVFRHCVACHTLKPDEGNRAGPTLHGLFGRRIATLPGYNFSPALTRLDIVWTPETVAKLFELGPERYTPGTKMPEQTIGSAAEREALVKFLERATK